MKVFFSVLMISITVSSFGQYFSTDLVDGTVPVTWLGIDFTEARIIKKANQAVDKERLSVLPNIWNEAVASQESTYPLKKAFHRSSINRDIDMMKSLNTEFDGSQMVTEELYLLYNYSIKMAFSRYNLDGFGDGIGMIFLVEAIDYAHKEFSGYMIPIDLKEKRIIRTYYLKTRFSYELETEDLIEPFRQILLSYGEKLDEKK